MFACFPESQHASVSERDVSRLLDLEIPPKNCPTMLVSALTCSQSSGQVPSSSLLGSNICVLKS